VSSCDITAAALREFFLYHHDGVSDAGVANFAACEHLERGTLSGGGTLRALAGKPALCHLRSGTQVTDAGLR
jgi:hypothetical protein